MTRNKTFEIKRVWCEPSRPSEVCQDYLAVEEPLEIRLLYGSIEERKTKSLSITMRTPGNDFDLVAGFLISENIIRQRSDIHAMRFVGPFSENFNFVSPSSTEQRPKYSSVETHRLLTEKDFLPNQIDRSQRNEIPETYQIQSFQPSNLVEVELQPSCDFDLSRLQRNVFLTSSCGICGKASLDSIRGQQISPILDPAGDSSMDQISAALIHRLPETLKEKQTVFQKTGGLHAAGLISLSGEWMGLQEDVGRHNAVDKLIGSRLLRDNFPLASTALILSGRASFELLQKSLLARIPVVVAVGAPSSLAVELAREFNITLVGFTSAEKFNIYAGNHRIV